MAATITGASGYIFNIYLFIYLYCCSIIVVPIFPYYSPLPYPPPPTHIQSPPPALAVVFVHGSFTHVP